MSQRVTPGSKSQHPQPITMIRLVGLLLATSLASQAASPVNLWNSDKNKLSVSGLDAKTPLSPALQDEEDAILC